MDIKPIRSTEDLSATLLRIEQIWGAEMNSPESDELEILARRVGEYEEQQFPIPPSEPFQEDKPGIDQRF
jgi:HTH-type transcriptional regulator/antitoxin HigA